MNGLAELLVANGGTLLTFAIFIGERIIQAAKDRTSTKQRIDDETVRAYLEWLRQQDHVLLLHTIEEKHDELVAYLAGDAARLKEVIEKTLQLLDSDFIDLKTQVAALDKAIQRPVLSSIPLNCRELGDVPLLSRDDDVTRLRQTTGDLIISGQPGSGKTFLLYHLDKEWNAKFLVSHDEGDILSYLRFSSPPVIIIDDAHDWLEIFPRLIHFRMETGRSFRIIAVCWPFEESDLMRVMCLSTKSLYRLSLLPAKAIAQLVKSRFEAKGYHVATWLIREIREQAAGRPGLALRLVDLLMEDGSLKSLKDGQAHFELIDHGFVTLKVSIPA
jgi:broad-specificity NMP kinase